MLKNLSHTDKIGKRYVRNVIFIDRNTKGNILFWNVELEIHIDVKKC